MKENDFETLWEKEFWTQQEVADYFRVVPSTIKKWRDQGLLSYWQAPGSTRVMYFSQEVKDFRDKNAVRTGGGKKQQGLMLKREKPIVSNNPAREWRI